jgi:1-deoxyxylulose-5-phosphate synthase
MLYTASANADQQVVDAVGRVAADRGVSHAQVALAWLLSRREVTSPIVGAGKLAHLEDAVAALGLELSSADCTALEDPYLPHARSFYQEVPGRDQDS